VIASDARVAKLSRHLVREGIDHAVLGVDGPSQRLTLVPATLVKGLEYDHVVVVEPAEIVEAEAHHWQGLRRLYVALTRAVSGLTVVHARALPGELATAAA
jgi:superfamily I DNA/RNA helicase